MAAFTFKRLMISAGLAALASLALGCADSGGGPERRTTPHLGTFGFDTAGMDRSVQPGDDFFQYANGTWVQNTEIPADRSSITSFAGIALKVNDRLREMVEAAAENQRAEGDARKIGDFYAAFMDEQGIEQRGLAPVRAELDAINRLSDKAQLSRYLGGTVRADVDLLNATDTYTDRIFGLWISQDFDDPSKVSPYLVAGGLGLPSRDFYLDSSARMAQMRAAYRQHIARVLTLAGVPDAEAKAGRILALESAIASVHWTAEDTNDPQKGNNHWASGEFARRAPGMDWGQFFQGAGMGSQGEFVVWQPSALSGIAGLVGSQPLETWKDYLTFHELDRSSPFLPRAFADENFAFYGSTLAGTPQQAPRWRRALNQLDGALGEAVGKMYVERWFPPESKTQLEGMVANLIRAFDARIDRLEWMSPETKAQAKRKLHGISVQIGYPSRWRDYSQLEVRRDDPLGNAKRASLFEYRRNLAKLGQPVNRDEWYLLPHQVNALNVPLENRLIFPAGILEPPFFDPNADPAVNYGAIGGVIGHEIVHSFDSIGALFDETGRLRNWWTPQDFARFEQEGRRLAAQYDGYQAFPDLNLNGTLTLSENIADAGGLNAAYDAYILSLNGAEPPVLDGFTGPQRVFLGWAQNYRSKYREPTLRNAVLTGVHSPGPWRAQTVRNVDAWYEAFNVQPGQRLYLAPEDRVPMW
ncbi:M13 family metallopeptidase [Brevundimonas sp. 2R-24]|uniref:M13 family metallopeptidase n=1 Tax=Peiella sedimenti TaxID=3061083 RepID=A0ABT8SI92_9CAUL|nr:M13 family metallopeptidase [Caulobacteraceae bacterium XZ-24]